MAWHGVQRWRSVATIALAILALFIAKGLALAADLRPGDFLRDCADCPELVVVPAGSFVMGSDDRYPAERPAHRVTLPRPFAIGRYEVTFGEWRACVTAGGCVRDPDDHGWGRGRRPVINVAWSDAAAYADWLSRRTGFTYRLPSEAEWEYAARAGTETAYWWGETPGAGNANCRKCGVENSERTTAVGSFAANAFGLYDVHGNVWEWVKDCWNPNYDGAPTDGSARLTGNCGLRVTRGGSWYYVSTNARAAYRSKFPAKAFSYGIGFRVVRELP